MRGDLLGEGHLVLLRDFSAKGRHKIQDLWGSVVHKGFKRVKGSVYTVVPVGDLTKVKRVHRSMLSVGWY